MSIDQNELLLKQFLAGEFDFVDLGCGTGNSIGIIEKRLNRRPGVGFDLNADKIREGQAQGRPVALVDVTKLQLPNRCVSFATMFDFLEHLPNEKVATNILSALSSAVRDFIIVRHPSFEHQDYLRSLGLKITWTDWHGHPNMMLVQDFQRIFKQLGWRDYLVMPQHQITDSNDSCIVPLSAPTDTVRYDAAQHGPKPFHVFSEIIYQQFDIFVPMRKLNEAEWRHLIDTFSADAELGRLKAAYNRAKDRREEAVSAYERLKARVEAGAADDATT